MKITILVDNKTEHPECEAEWGLSLLIETNGKSILFDAGASDMFFRNANQIGVNLEAVDAAIISHGHYDHTEGFPAFTSVNKCAPIYVHENAFHDYYGSSNGSIDEMPTGIRWKDAYFDSIKNRMVFTKNKLQIFSNVDLIGNIQQPHHSSITENFYKKENINGDARFTLDDMSHEQILVVKENDKMYVFSGCSHVGVSHIIATVRSLYPNTEIEAFVGGMHLYACAVNEIDTILDDMKENGVRKLVPLHCTGMRPILRMKEQLGENCILAMAGDTVIFE